MKDNIMKDNIMKDNIMNKKISEFLKAGGTITIKDYGKGHFGGLNLLFKRGGHKPNRFPIKGASSIDNVLSNDSYLQYLLPRKLN